MVTAHCSIVHDTWQPACAKPVDTSFCLVPMCFLQRSPHLPSTAQQQTLLSNQWEKVYQKGKEGSISVGQANKRPGP